MFTATAVRRSPARRARCLHRTDSPPRVTWYAECHAVHVAPFSILQARRAYWSYPTWPKTVFTRSAITRQNWTDLEHCRYIAGGRPWQTLGVIRAAATVGKAAEILLFCQVNNARFRRFLVGNISRNFNTTTTICVAM